LRSFLFNYKPISYVQDENVVRWWLRGARRPMVAQRSPDASAIYGSRTTRKHPFQLKKEIRRGKSQKRQKKGGFWWGERAGLPAGVGAELQHFVLKWVLARL